MGRMQRLRLAGVIAAFVVLLLLALLLSRVDAAPGDVPWEMIVISTTPIGPTPALCQGPLGQYSAAITILDQPVWYTHHGPSAVPSASVGALGGPGTVVIPDFATQFKAIRQGATDARGYVVCIPK